MSNLISAQDLHDRLNDPGLVVVDTRFDLQNPGRGRQDYEAGHIPGAVYMDLDKDLSAPPKEHGGRHPLPDMQGFANTLECAGISNSSSVVVYDDSGGLFAGRLWWMLRYSGHDAVRVLDGGLSAWRAAGFETSAEVPVVEQGVFTLDLRPEMVADMREVRAKLEDPNTLLIDARGAERYRGDTEPLDKKAGHIPGAFNLPFAENLQEGRFKDAGALKSRFEDLEGAEEIVVYCGSGVSAAHDLLAMEEAGLRNARLYVGSWSDWSSYDDLPVATGDEV